MQSTEKGKGENGCVLMEAQFEGGGAAVQEDGVGSEGAAAAGAPAMLCIGGLGV